MESEKVGLQMNLSKKKVMTDQNVIVEIDQNIIERVEEYAYLGHKIELR